MLPELQPTAAAFALNAWLLDSLVKDFDPEDWDLQDACGHGPKWIVGHLATYRHRALALLGQAIAAPAWEAVFTRGRGTSDIPANLDVQEVISAFTAAQAALAGRWGALTAEDLVKPTGRRLPDGSEDVGGAIRFLAWHETYHLGQLGLLRRLAGKPGVA